MKYFTALADAAFARSAFLAAGLDFDKAIAAKDADCIKSAIAANKGEDAEAILAAAKTENDELKAKVAQDSKTASDKISSLTVAIEAQGFKLADAIDANGAVDSAKLAEQKKALVAREARDLVAKAGHPGILDTPVTDPKAKKKDETKPALVGADRLAADFNSQLAAMQQKGNTRQN